MTVHNEIRTPFASQTTKTAKRSAGRTDVHETPLEVRVTNADVEAPLEQWVYERMGRQLGKYAIHIERIQVRFEESGSAGTDKLCAIHLTLSKLPPLMIEARGSNEREAFDRAAGRAVRALHHSVERHGFHAHSARYKRAGEQLDDAELSMPEES